MTDIEYVVVFSLASSLVLCFEEHWIMFLLLSLLRSFDVPAQILMLSVEGEALLLDRAEHGLLT